MDNFLHGNITFMNETSLNEHRLIFINNMMSNRRYPIRINFSPNIKQDVNKSDQSKLLAGSMHLTLGMRENAKLKTHNIHGTQGKAVNDFVNILFKQTPKFSKKGKQASHRAQGGMGFMLNKAHSISSGMNERASASFSRGEIISAGSRILGARPVRRGSPDPNNLMWK